MAAKKILGLLLSSNFGVEYYLLDYFYDHLSTRLNRRFCGKGTRSLS